MPLETFYIGMTLSIPLHTAYPSIIMTFEMRSEPTTTTSASAFVGVNDRVDLSINIAFL